MELHELDEVDLNWKLVRVQREIEFLRGQPLDPFQARSLDGLMELEQKILELLA